MNSPTIADFNPYESLRENQIEGVETLQNCIDDNGFLLMEGACGTGKTLLSLLPSLEAVRDPSTKFSRIVVVTSVKQQISVFEDELEAINSSLEDSDSDIDPVSSLTLVGKSDVCPYVIQDEISERAIYSRCDELRDNTSELFSRKDSPSELYSSQRSHGGSYAYPDSVPADADTDTDYCPYYANHIERSVSDSKSVTPRSLSNAGVVDVDTLVSTAGSVGTCPHSVMGDYLSDAEVVIGNYKHIFDSGVADTFTGDLLSDETILIVDEAHNLVSRVRDIYSEQLALSTMQRAIGEAEYISTFTAFSDEELRTIESAVTGFGMDVSTLDDTVRDKVTRCSDAVEGTQLEPDSISELIEMILDVESLYETAPISADVIEAWITFTEDLHGVIGKLVSEELKSQDTAEYEITIPLQDPEDATDTDRLSDWISLYPDDTGAVKEYGQIGSILSQTTEFLYEQYVSEDTDPSNTPQPVSQQVGMFIDTYTNADVVSHFRSIELERSMNEMNAAFEWGSEYTAKLELYNCLPNEEIANTLDIFGSGVLMSATLEPLNVFSDVSGLSTLEDSSESEPNGRPIYTSQFGLTYPEENRKRIVVDLPAFKYQAKDTPFTDSDLEDPNIKNTVRQKYLSATSTVISQTTGSVLIVLPSYTEAKWMYEVLNKHSKASEESLYLDTASTNAETESLKQDFFTDDSGILITGAHGTLTEGVDYYGDRLSAVICLGVPLANTNEPKSKALISTFDEYYGNQNGFEYAFTIPAIRKVRQALGRVIRSNTDVGTTVLLDERYDVPYTSTGDPVSWSTMQKQFTEHVSWRSIMNSTNVTGSNWDNVRRFFSETEHSEFTTVKPEDLHTTLQSFWNEH